MHFTDIIPVAFSSPFWLLPEDVACSQAAPEDVFSDLLRGTGEWPFRGTHPAPSSLLTSQNCRAWRFDSGSREQRGFSFYNTDCHPGNRRDGAFFFSVDQGILVCVKAQTACTLTSGHVFTQKLGPLHFLAFFFLSQRE